MEEKKDKQKFKEKNKENDITKTCISEINYNENKDSKLNNISFNLNNNINANKNDIKYCKSHKKGMK